MPILRTKVGEVIIRFFLVLSFGIILLVCEMFGGPRWGCKFISNLSFASSGTKQEDIIKNLKKIGATKEEIEAVSILIETGAPQDEIQNYVDSIEQRAVSKLDVKDKAFYYSLRKDEKLDYLASSNKGLWIQKRDEKLIEQYCMQNGEVAYYSLKNLLTKNELQEFIRQDSTQKEIWLKSYWASKDPTPTTERNEWKDEFQRRVDFVVTNFHSSFGYSPWDERGDIYIKLGDPEERMLDLEEDSELWTYYQKGKEICLKFQDKKFRGYMELVPYKARRTDFDFVAESYILEHELTQKPAEYRHDYGGKQLNFAWEIIRFRHLVNTYEILVHIGIPLGDLKKDSLNQIHYSQRIAIRDERGEIVRADSALVQQEVSATKNQLLIDQQSFFLSPGIYSVALETRDLLSKKIGIYRDELFLPAYTPKDSVSSGLFLSRAILSSKLLDTKCSRTNKFCRNGYLVIPNPGHIFFTEQEPDIAAYFEIYDSAPKNDTLETISRILKYSSAEDSILVNSDTFYTIQQNSISALYQIIPLLKSPEHLLEPGNYVWRIDVKDKFKTESIVNFLKIKE